VVLWCFGVVWCCAAVVLWRYVVVWCCGVVRWCVGVVVNKSRYYNGSFSQPGLGGGKFTPLSLKPEGLVHFVIISSVGAR
jgi:hypothetical protein